MSASLDRKDRLPSPSSSSHGNVVDHDAPHVTDDIPRENHRASAPKSHTLKVQPLRKDEMQPSYAQDMGVENVHQGRSLYATVHSILPVRDPGLVRVNVCTESLRVVDVKIQIISIGRQSVITRTTSTWKCLIERAMTTLRHVVGARAVQSVVTEREAIAFEIAEIVGDVADKWGVAIEGILIKDIIFSPNAAQQKRIGESKVIAARAEVDAARLMRLQQMAKSAHSKVVFVPMQLQSDVIGHLGQPQAGPSTVRVQDEDLGAVGRAGLLNTISDV
ncbi:hypothetical protein BGW80DRAFT_1284461 [Lactifluus volemus]|nr:hypothetical protein BGW80DRAFT_1284461 [Lactifluus volemus]